MTSLFGGQELLLNRLNATLSYTVVLVNVSQIAASTTENIYFCDVEQISKSRTTRSMIDTMSSKPALRCLP